MSTTLTVDASGSVTLPADVCREAGAGPGSKLVVEAEAGRIVLNKPRPPIWERILALTADMPPEELDKLPRDGASQHDHYIYGTPKRPE